MTDLSSIRLLKAELNGPLAVMATPGAPSVAELLACGVNRVSTGQGVMLATLGLISRIARELQESGTYEARQDTFFGFQEAEDLFT